MLACYALTGGFAGCDRAKRDVFSNAFMDEVNETGEEIVITRHGKTVARLP